MTERNPFEKKPAEAGQVPGQGSLHCEEWEILLTDALDGALAVNERQAFDAHGTECAVCAELLSQAKKGQEWLQFLEAEPEVPTDLVERIVSKTSGSVAGGPLAMPGATPIGVPVQVLGLPVRHLLWDSRIMMTVAMAFFSVALTLNLAGVKLTNLKLSDLTPASMEMNLSRQFWGAQKSLARYYNNMRLVYEVESKVHDLRKAEEMQQSSPQPQPQQQVPANPTGNGHKNGGMLEPTTKIPSEGLLWGRPTLASVEGPQVKTDQTETKEEVEIRLLCERVQAERSLA